MKATKQYQKIATSYKRVGEKDERSWHTSGFVRKIRWLSMTGASILLAGCATSSSVSITPPWQESEDVLKKMTVVEFSEDISSKYSSRRFGEPKLESFYEDGLEKYRVTFRSNSILPDQILESFENYCTSYDGMAFFDKNGWCLRGDQNDFRVMLRASREGPGQYSYTIQTVSTVGNSKEAIGRYQMAEVQSDIQRREEDLSRRVERERKEQEKRVLLGEPKYLGQRVCKDYQDNLGSSMIGVGNVNLVGDRGNIQIMVDRIYVNSPVPQLRSTVNDTLWDSQYSWYACNL